MEQILAAIHGAMLGILVWMVKAVRRIHQRLTKIEVKLFGNGKGDPS